MSENAKTDLFLTNSVTYNLNRQRNLLKRPTTKFFIALENALIFLTELAI